MPKHKRRTDRGTPIQILLVEDSPGDLRLTTEALARAKVANEVVSVSDGEAAISLLRHQGQFADAVRPDLVLLDLNLPKKDGREVLAEMKSDPRLATIPVVVLTASKDEEDVLRSYQLHANAYVRKPVGFAALVDVVQRIESFWLQIVELPAK
jgi:two-component system, chemotaxis family, response regulator Rcp1